jgi:RNA polymerase sigma factor (TIGR02999 family)
MSDVTALLVEWSKGDRGALDALMPLVYGELQRLARRYWRSENKAHTLEPTVLVHEAFLRLVNQNRVNWQNRAQFFGVAAQMIRRVLVDHARGRHRLKRGADPLMVTWSDTLCASESLERTDLDVIGLDRALRRLAELDLQQSSIVELRFFGGLSIEETAEALKISPATVKRDWGMARAWLHRELSRA